MLSPSVKQTSTSNEKIKCLFDLGDAGQSQDWQDYLKLGFDQSDVPDLLELVADEGLNSADLDSNDIWVPVHAWRALGQIGHDSAVAPLITLFDRFADDNCALEDMPKVMGMIGTPAIVPLCEYINAFQHDAFARTMAAEALAEIVKRAPDCREQVVRCYRDCLSEPDRYAKILNAVLVCKLVELGAKEAIDAIRQLYDIGCVDMSCSGDLETVEIELGIRTDRSTAVPANAELLGLDSLPEPEITHENDDLGFIDYCLKQYGNDDAIRDVSELNGFLTALACAPNPISSSRWMPAIWGRNAPTAASETQEEFEAFTRAVSALHGNVMDGLKENAFKPLFQQHQTENETFVIVEPWCEGFMRGRKLWGPLSSGEAALAKACLHSIRLFTTDAGFEQLVTMTEEKVVARQQAIETDVRRLFQHLSEQRSPVSQTTVRDNPKVGRNDPCPCGSGKKYKKCCKR